MKIPFIGPEAKSVSGFVNHQQSINLYMSLDPYSEKAKYFLRGTPGLTEFCTTGQAGATRCMHIFGDKLYVVAGDSVYEVTIAGVSSLLGAISTSTGYVSMADNGVQVIIVDGTDNGHLIIASVLSDIADPDFPSSTSVVFHDGYFVVSEATSGRIWVSKLYDGVNWNALDFATAEANADNLVGLGTTQQNIWLMGALSTEVYYASGNPDFPFDRVPGAIIDIGCGSIGSIVEIQGKIYWMTDKGTIVRNEGYSYQPISSKALNYQMSTYSVVNDATSYTYSLEGETFYVIAFPTAGKTWVCNIETNMWHEWESAI